MTVVNAFDQVFAVKIVNTDIQVKIWIIVLISVIRTLIHRVTLFYRKVLPTNSFHPNF